MPQTTHLNTNTDSGWQLLYRIGSLAAALQLLCTITIIVAFSTLGAEPKNAEEYFALLGGGKIVDILRTDFVSLGILFLYIFTALSLYGLLRRVNEAVTLLATVCTLMGVMCVFASHSGFSMLHLSELYSNATTEAIKLQILTIGESMMASDMWHSTASYMAGILLQGAGIILSVLMLKSGDFGKFTAYSGIIANGLDLVQHTLKPFSPSLMPILLMIAGPFYLVWFPLLSRDFFRASRK